jgi:CBS domain-containing protein
MRKNDPITNLMVTDVITLQVGQSVSEARKTLAEKGFHHLPVLDGEKLVGMVSRLDIVRLTFEAYDTDERTMDAVLDSQFTLAQVMKPDLVTVSHKDTVRRATNLLSDGTFHSLPVVGEDGKLEGIVTSTDLIRYLMKQYN